jgi:lambda repressor-like predicted transcriptional regulator
MVNSLTEKVINVKFRKEDLPKSYDKALTLSHILDEMKHKEVKFILPFLQAKAGVTSETFNSYLELKKGERNVYDKRMYKNIQIIANVLGIGVEDLIT